jgi:hypothetical protein
MHDVGTSTRPRSLRFIAALLGALAASTAATASAQPRPAPAVVPAGADVEGTVVAIQGEELVLDLGAARGASDGVTVEIWRPLKLKHPVTGKPLVDRFRIGSLELVQVRGTLSLAKQVGALTRPPEVGDIVVLAGTARSVGTPKGAAPKGPEEPAQPTPPAVEKVPEDPDARAVGEMFESLKGADLTTRVAHYEEHAKTHPQSRFGRVLLEEAAALRELMQAREKKASEKEAMRARGAPQIGEALAGTPLRVSVELSPPAKGAILHVRRAGAPTFASLPMAATGGGYFAVKVPAEMMVGGTIEYFIEAVAPKGEAVAVVGGAAMPKEIEVFEPPSAGPPKRYPMKLELSGEYADYNRLRNNDWAVQTEGTFGVRYGDVGVRALRLGFGVYRGRGGSVDELDKQNLAGRAIGLTYGYLETEIAFMKAFSFIVRGAVGLVDTGISGGGQVLVRIGSDLKTNLVLGGEFLGGVGLRGITQLELQVFERVPILLRTEVTNQPAGMSASVDEKTSGSAGSIGGRGIVQVGYKFTPDLVVALRGSFQGRTIQHAGPGFGAAVGYTW